MSTPRDPSYCSFCGKSQGEVKRLIAGPNVFICNECVDLCKDIIETQEPPTAFIVRDRRSALEQWCRELVGDEHPQGSIAARWAVFPAKGLPQSEVATWKVVIPSSFAELFKMSWPQAKRPAE